MTQSALALKTARQKIAVLAHLKPARIIAHLRYGRATPSPSPCFTKNWIRGVLGSSETDTAKKYGMALYDARSLSWEEIERHRSNPNDRDATIAAKKNRQWMKVAEQIKGEDAEAYEYLQGTKGMERIGAGFIAMLAAVLFALF